MSRGRRITPELWASVKRLCDMGTFTRKEIAKMSGISVSAVGRVKGFNSFEEAVAASRAALKLSEARRKEKEDEKSHRESEAKEAYLGELKRIQCGDAPTPVFPEDDIEMKVDILTEKVDKILELLKDIYVAQKANENNSNNDNSTYSYYQPYKPF